MRQPPINNDHLMREQLRQEIARQVDDFIKKGGAIEQLSVNQRKVKPVEPDWKDGFSLDDDESEDDL
jgi:hypothetical protein